MNQTFVINVIIVLLFIALTIVFIASKIIYIYAGRVEKSAQAEQNKQVEKNK